LDRDGDMTDWTRYEDDADERRCALSDYLACGVLVISVLAGIAVGWCGHAWLIP